jgi:hypothetical protein
LSDLKIMGLQKVLKLNSICPDTQADMGDRILQVHESRGHRDEE